MYIIESINQQGILVRSILVACLPAILEWPQYPSTPLYLITPGILCPNRCFRDMGLCSGTGISVVTMAMATGMVRDWDNG